MKILDSLRKLGILRGGVVAGTYKSYKEMPDELMYDNVYDKKKDLVDVGSASLESKKSSRPVLVWLFWFLLIFSILIVTFLFLMMKANIWFFILLLIWLYFIYLIFSYKKGLRAIGFILVYFFVSIFVSVVLLFIGVDTPTLAGKNEALEKNKYIADAKDCKTLAAKYDGKIFSIRSDQNLQGGIGFRVDKENCKYEITWHTVFESPNIVRNVPDAQTANTGYDYVADLVFAKEGSSPLDGTIDPVFQNKDKLPADIFNIRVPYTFYQTEEVINNTNKNVSTQTFHHVMQSAGTFSQATIDDILGVKKINIYARATGLTGSPVAEFGVDISDLTD